MRLRRNERTRSWRSAVASREGKAASAEAEEELTWLTSRSGGRRSGTEDLPPYYVRSACKPPLRSAITFLLFSRRARGVANGFRVLIERIEGLDDSAGADRELVVRVERIRFRIEEVRKLQERGRHEQNEDRRGEAEHQREGEEH